MRILNDPSSGTNAASFIEQARPDASDFDILSAAFDGVGVISGGDVSSTGGLGLSVDDGVFLFGSASPVSGTTLTIGTADGTHDRIDLVVTDGSTYYLIPGTAAAIPTPPDLDFTIVLATVIVPAGTTSLDATNLLDKRIFLPAPLGLSGAGSPEAVYTAPIGQQYVDTDTGITWRKVSGIGNKGWGHGSGATIDDPVFLGTPVDLVTAGPVSTFTYDNGTAGVGATCTATANGEMSLVDGHLVTVNQRVCFSTLGDPTPVGGYEIYFGIYVVTQVGDGGSPWILTRSTDCDTPAVLGSFWTVFAGDLGSTCQSAQCLAYPYPSDPTAFAIGSDCLDISVQIAAPGNVNNYSWAPGVGATAFGFGSTAMGNCSTAIGEASVAVGASSVSLGSGSVTLGSYGLAYDSGQTVRASAGTTVGACQSSVLVSGFTTTDGSLHQMSNAQGNPHCIQFVDQYQDPIWNRTMIVTARVVARRTDTPGTDSAWSFQGVLRGDGSSAYTWVGGFAPTATVIAQDAAASAWIVGIDVAVDGSTSELRVTVSGDIGSTIAWECTLELDEVAG